METFVLLIGMCDNLWFHLILTDSNKCNSNPCQHNGTCIGDIDTFSCVCDSEHFGTFCETGTLHVGKNRLHFNKKIDLLSQHNNFNH